MLGVEAEPEPATAAELAGYLERRFPCQSWTVEDARPDGSVFFRCQCAGATGWYPSDEAGVQALDAHSGGGEAAREAFVIDWFARHPAARPAQDQPAAASEKARSDGSPVPRGLIEVVLSRQQLIAALDASLPALTGRLGLRLERSWGDRFECDVACLETSEDEFTLVHWESSDAVEVYATIEPGEPRADPGPLERFLEVAELTWNEVRYPPRRSFGQH
jgi:hypothetical protein